MTHPTEPADRHSPAEGHTTYDSEISPHGVYWAAAILVGTVLVALAAMWGLLEGMQHQDRKRSPAASVLQDEIDRSRSQGPSGPLLQPDPTRDMVDLRASEDAALTSYGWVDRASGTVRIPISEAMDRLAAQGLGMHPAPSAATAAGGAH